MKLIFAGTPEFAATALAALTSAGHDVWLVLTQPDRRGGRGMREHASPVKQLALAHGIRVFQPPTLRDPAVQEELRRARAEAMVVAAYGLILPAAVLAIPPRGCINIHASLLPRWRGAAPIQRALLAGDTETGISIMQMDTGLDTGPVLLQRSLSIEGDDTAGTLHDKLARLGARTIIEALREPHVPQPQNEAAATYAAKITKADAHVDWTQPALAISRQIRAYNPAPGAATSLSGKPLKLWRAAVDSVARGEPGTVLATGPNGISVAAGQGAITLAELQLAGGKRLHADAFLSGHPLVPGMRLGT